MNSAYWWPSLIIDITVYFGGAEYLPTLEINVQFIILFSRDETLLCQGIALNDELQQLLAKYQSLTSGTPLPEEQPKLESNSALVSADAPLIDTGDDSVPSVAR